MTPWKSGRRYSSDLRELVVKAVEGGQAPQSVAQTYRMTLNTVKRYVAQKADGTLHQVKGSGGRPRIVQEHHELQLLKQAEEKPDATLDEHRMLLEEATGLKISFKTVDRVFRRHKIKHKKKSHRQRAQRGIAEAIPERDCSTSFSHGGDCLP